MRIADQLKYAAFFQAAPHPDSTLVAPHNIAMTNVHKSNKTSHRLSSTATGAALLMEAGQ
jgi:hypothetical protein